MVDARQIILQVQIERSDDNITERDEGRLI